VLFWLIAGVLMFLSALNIDHWNQVIPRFFYYPVLGLLISALMTLIYQSEAFRRQKYPLVLILGVSILAGILTALVLNPMTFLMVGASMEGRHTEVISTGLLYHTLFFVLWSVLYLQMDGRPLPGAGRGKRNSEKREAGRGGYIDVIGVDDRGEVRRLPVGEIEFIAASGDYVEINLADRCYLKKETTTGLEALLDPAVFQRIHRSTIINTQKVSAVDAKGSGAFKIRLASGKTVHSSRSYYSVVVAMKNS
jgi:hypothetical protein